MEVQCFEMWGKVKLEKLQNDPSLVSHSIFFSVLMKEFPNVSFVVMHSNMNINMDSNKRVHCKQTNNKQTNKDVWAFKKRTQTINLTERSPHEQRHKKMKWQGLDLHRFSCLLSQESLISSVFIDFNDITRAQYRVDDPSACTTAWHRILMLLMS